MIRCATVSDLNNIYHLCEEYNNDFRKLFNLENEIYNDYSILLLEENENDIISFLFAQDFKDNYDILFLVVEKNYQKQGYGTKLLNFFVNNYIINNQIVILEVAADNIDAIRLYKKFGFRQINIRKGYYNGVDGIVLRRE